MSVNRSGGRPMHQYWTELDFKMVRPNGQKRNGAFCNKCKKTLKNTAVGRLQAHRKSCGFKMDMENGIILKCNQKPEPVSEAETDNIEAVEWTLQESHDEQGNETTYQIVEAVEPSESIKPESYITEVTVRSPTLHMEEIINQEITSRVQSKQKQSKSTQQMIEIQPVPLQHQQIQQSVLTPEEKESIDTALSMFLIGCNLTFDLVDNEYFRSLVHALNPNYKIPTCKNLTKSLLHKLSSNPPNPSTSRSQNNGYSCKGTKRKLINESESEDESNKRHSP